MGFLVIHIEGIRGVEVTLKWNIGERFTGLQTGGGGGGKWAGVHH